MRTTALLATLLLTLPLRAAEPKPPAPPTPPAPAVRVTPPAPPAPVTSVAAPPAPQPPSAPRDPYEVTPAAAGKAATEADIAVHNKLNRKVTFEFADTPLGEAVAFIQQIAAVNVIIEPEVEKSAAITLRVQDMELNTALKWAARMANAEFEIKDGTVVISEQRAVRERREAELARAKPPVNSNQPQRIRISYDKDRVVELEGASVHEQGLRMLRQVEETQALGRDALKEGILFCSPTVDFPSLSTSSAQEIIRKAAPTAKIVTEGDVWIITAEDEPGLRRAGAALNYIRSLERQKHR